MNFRVGDRVLFHKEKDRVFEGIVRSVPRRLSRAIGFELTSDLPLGYKWDLHSCGGLVPQGWGWWVSHSQLTHASLRTEIERLWEPLL